MKFQSKYTVFMDFLSSLLREEGGLDYKTAIVDTIINIIEGKLTLFFHQNCVYVFVLT